MRPSAALAPRTIWSYEYGEAEGAQLRLKILLVFFAQDRYDGYLWFSSDSTILTEVTE